MEPSSVPPSGGRKENNAKTTAIIGGNTWKMQRNWGRSVGEHIEEDSNESMNSREEQRRPGGD